MEYYRWIVFIHIIAASAFVMTVIIMQLVVANVMKRIPDSSGKQDGARFIQKKWLPVVDIIIILVGIAGLGLVALNYNMILSRPLFLVKIVIGAITLSAAYINHFYLRSLKKRLASSGKESERLKRVGRIVLILNKVILIGAPVTALLGWYANHVAG